MLTHTNQLTKSCLLIVVGLLLGYIESLFPVIPFHGIKVGISNIVILYSLYTQDLKYTYSIGALKSILNGILFTGILSIVYSFLSVMASISVMYIFKKNFSTEKISVYGISVSGSALFNLSQLTVASVILNTTAILNYIPIMLIISLPTGIISAFLTGLILKKI